MHCCGKKGSVGRTWTSGTRNKAKAVAAGAGGIDMPILSMFYGIVIRLYFFDDKQHHVPHIHAEYAGQRAVFSIDDGQVLVGTLPSGKTRLVQA